MKIEVKGIKRIQAAIREAKARGENMTEVWDDVGKILKRSFSKNFRAEGRPDKWKPLAASTLQKKGGGYKILTLSGQLQRSISHVPDSRGVTIGTNMVYGAIHQYGGTAGRGAKIPARPYLVVQDPEDYEAIAEQIEAFIAGAFD